MHARSTIDANRQIGDPAKAQPDNQTKRQPDRREVPGRQRRTGAEKAAYRIRVAIVQLSANGGPGSS